MAGKRARGSEGGAIPERRLEAGWLEDMIGYHLRRAQMAAFQSFQSFVGEADITPGRLGVLALIEANPGLNQTELANALAIDRSTMVAVIDRLEARGLVTRRPSPADRRTYALHVTPEGVDFLAKIFRRIEEHERALAARLKPAERAQLIELLRRIVADR